MRRHGCPNAALAFSALVAVAAAAAPATAQETGRITGEVIQAATQRPVVGAQVSIPGTGAGGLTNASGNFLLLQVPTGPATVRVQMVGYGIEEQTVTVSAAAAAVANFELTESAIALEQIVVTGAGVATEKKKLGNTIATINTAALETAPVNTVSEMLQGREPGLVGLPTSGLAGEGSRIRIRGSSSLSQSNEPIVYIDGVRVDRGGGFGMNVGAGGAGTPSRLDDINPASIERIEVLKGAAAATLYGTEASNGVIQIFTKDGQQGETRWTFQAEQGVTSVPTGRMIPHASFWCDPSAYPEGTSVNITDRCDPADAPRIEERWGASLVPFEVFERSFLPSFFETGRTSVFSGSVSGGGSDVTYFASGRYALQDGPFGLEELGPARDRNQKVQASAAINLFPIENLRLRLSTFYTETHHETPQNSNNIYAPFPLGFHSQLRLASANNLFGAPTFATTRESMHITNMQDAEHFAGVLNANYRLSEEVMLDATFGVDAVNQRSVGFTPFGWNVDDFTENDLSGARNISDRNHRELTVDLKGSWDRTFGSDFSSTFLFGGQGFLRQTETSGGDGEEFPGPGLEVAGAGAQQTLFEQWIRNVNAGIYAQEQVGFRDYVFVTVGARYDANSAFGEEFTGVLYPKASVSLIPSDALDWPYSTVSTLRLRAAIGQSGLQPDAFDKFTTYEALASALGPGIEPDNLGNQELEPEISTEWELGAEIGLFDDRAALNVTYWDRTVADALIARQFPVTGGFIAQQLDNVGQIDANGLEVQLNGGVISTRNFSLDLFANASYLDEIVTDMGGAPPLKVSGSYPRDRNFIKEGYAPGAMFGAVLADVPYPLDVVGDCTVPSREQALDYFSQPRSPDDFEVIPTNCGGDYLDTYMGKPTPDWQGGFGGHATFFGSFELSTLFEYKYGDYFVHDLSGSFRQSNALIGRNTPVSARVTSTLMDPASTAEQRLDAAMTWATQLRSLAPMSGMNFINRADFLRWRELALTYNLPSQLVQSFNVRSASVTLSGRNLLLWVHEDYTGLDPEVHARGRCVDADIDCNFQLAQEAWGVPIPRRFSVAVRMGF